MKKFIITISLSALIVSSGFFYFHKHAKNENINSIAEKSSNGVEEENTNNIVDAKHIIFNTMPKSGSIFIAKTLEKGLGIPFQYISPGYALRDNISPEKFEQFNNSHAITQEHLDPSLFNTQLLEKYSSKMILHLRDPRQACLSWIHHQNKLYKQNDTNYLYYVAPTAPMELYEQDLTKQIDWYIENYLPNLVTWMDDWFKYIDSKPQNVEIIVLTYEQFLQDNNSYIDKILEFYEIPKENYKQVEIAKDSSTHFRNGEHNEWRTVMSEQQISRCNQIIPPHIIQRLGLSY